eukprot:jgi/Ulvmu1/5862/UM025_0124.1
MSSSHESDRPPPTLYSISKGLLAGGIAGGLSRTAVAPIERLKILMQVQGNDKVYTNMWQGFMHMTKTGGLREWFKGNGTNCIRIVPNSAVKFVTYNELSRLLSNQRKQQTGDGTLNPVLRMLAGAVAGIIAMSSTYHLDMVRGRLTVQEGSGRTQQYRGIMHAYQDIIQKEGVLALYRGWLPSVIGVIPYVGLNFAVYETLKDMAVKRYGVESDRELSSSLRLSAGGVAGTIGQTIAYPFDVVRRRLQVSGWDGAKRLHEDHGHAIRYRGMVDCFVRTVREEGAGALFKGIVPNYVKVIPSIAIAFVVYEHVCEALDVEVKISASAG